MKIDLKWADSAPKTQFSARFLQGMLNRVAVGFIRYGDFRTNGHDMKDHVRKALDRYEKTGNTEFLIDVANYAMMEFVQPSITGAHFTPSDSDPTPSITAFFHAKGKVEE